MTNIILCGGNGTRLWPISRTLMPKQFAPLFDGKSLFQLTVSRNRKICNAQFVVSNAEQYFLAVDQLSRMKIEQNTFLLESVGRNTAPAIALACLALPEDEIVLVTPSDHMIRDEEQYIESVKIAVDQAKSGHLVTFGITPEYPETGFGYIEASLVGSEPGVVGSVNAMDVVRFHEKPNLETAKAYLAANELLPTPQQPLNTSPQSLPIDHEPLHINLQSLTTIPNRYFWNSGMFCFRVGTFLAELATHSPEIHTAAVRAFENRHYIAENQFRIGHDEMTAIPEDSIDYAVMEKSSIVKVIPATIGWSDLGSFDALYDELPKNDEGNTLHHDHISLDSKNNLIYSNKTIATVDIEDLIVIDTCDALLISRKGSTQKVKEVVSELKRRGSNLHNIHLIAHRPWGSYTILEDTPGYKIKKIVVHPGKRLSLQKHFHRSEHWIVVSGTATVTIGDETALVRPNESTYIRMGDIHRLENNGKIDLVLIEAQVGEYTGEDDIVRIEDDFKRA